MCNKATFSEIRFSNAHVILSSWNTDTLRTIHFSKRSINFLRFFTYLISFYTSKHSGRRKNICIYPPSFCWKIQLIKKNHDNQTTANTNLQYILWNNTIFDKFAQKKILNEIYILFLHWIIYWIQKHSFIIDSFIISFNACIYVKRAKHITIVKLHTFTKISI